MAEVLETVAGFRDSYLATLGLALMCAYLGTFTLLRRIVFTGAALSQASAAGVALSFWLASLALPAGLAAVAAGVGPTGFSLIVSVGCALFLGVDSRRGTLSADARVGIVFAASSALAVLLVWRSSQGLVELQSLLAGDVLLSGARQRTGLWVGLAAVAVVHAPLRARFLLVGYDREFARAQGLRVALLERVFLVMLAVAIAVSLRTGGLMLVFGTLVLAPALGLRVAPNLSRATLAAVGGAWTSAMLGFVVASAWNLPVAPTIVSLQLAALMLAVVPGSALFLERGAQLGGVAALGFVVVLPAFAAAPAPLPEVRGRPFVSARAPDPAPARPSAFAGLPDPPGHGEVAAAEGGLMSLIADQAARLSDPASPLGRRIQAARLLSRLPDPRVVRPLVEASGDLDAVLAERALEGLATVCRDPHGLCRRELLLLSDAPEPELAALATRAALRVGDRAAAARLVDCLADDSLPLLLRESLLAELVRAHGEGGFGFDPFGDPAENAEALAAWRTWAAEG